MEKIKNKYIFKYDKDGHLYNYVELNKVDKVISYFKLEHNRLIRFDKNTQTKQSITFKSNVKLKQKFMAGESFISVFDLNETVQYGMPEKEKEIILVKNNVKTSDFGKFVVKKWEELNKEKGITYSVEPESNSIKTTTNTPTPTFLNDYSGTKLNRYLRI